MSTVYPWLGVLERWTLDETSGTRASTFTGVDLTTVNGSFTGNQYAAGKFGNCLHLFGTDSGVQRGSGTTGVSSGTGDFTVSAWVKWTTGGATHSANIINRTDITSGFPDYVLDSTDNADGTVSITFSMNDSGTYTTTPYSLTHGGTWHHILATYTDSTGYFDLWVDGTRRAHDHLGTISPRDTHDGVLVIGDDGAGGHAQTYDIDDVILWRRALSSAEIAAIASGLAFGDSNADIPLSDGKLYVEIRDPAGVVRSILGVTDRYVSIDAEQGQFGYESVEITLPPDAPVLSETYSGNTFYAEHAGWTVWVIYRDYDWRDGVQAGASRNDCFAKGAVVAMVDDDVTDGGSTTTDLAYNVKITAMGLCDWILGSRLTMNASWARYKRSSGGASVSTYLAHIVETQTDNTYRPSGYNSAGGDRTVFGYNGMFARSGTGVNTVSSAAATLSTWRVDSGRSLLDTIREFSKQYSIGWSFRVSPTSGTFGNWKLHIYSSLGVDRTAGGGTDVTFSRSLQNLVKLRREKDDTSASSMFFVSGHGYRAKQAIGWAKDSSLYTRLGNRETGERHDTAWADELSYESGNLQTVFAHGYENYEATIREDDATRFGWEYGVGDIVRVIDESRGIVILKRIVKASVSSSSPTLLRLWFNEIPSYMDGADGGGGGRGTAGAAGHRRMGGPPVPVAGEPGVPNYWVPDEGDSLQFDNANDTVWLKSDPNCNCPGTITRGVDPGDGNGEDDDTIEKAYLRTCFTPCPTPSAVTIGSGTACNCTQDFTPTYWLRLCQDLGGGTSACRKVPAWDCP